MPLAAGTRLGPYEIGAPIGKGGMGEVYRARDTKLGREVAIKILPEELAADEERVARFEREAKLLASLNHPNIAAIYGFEGTPQPERRATRSGVAEREVVGVGPHDTEICAIVLELVEGQTLAARIARGAIPIDEALPIAKQIAEALEAGHEVGVVHRDLKPANVKVRDDGTVKVLDYGLAKALEGDAPGGGSTELSLSHSPTLTRQGTQAGVILGTAPYMSPEQARGKRVDRRADIWAFGAVLYEMLTGARAFEGEDVADTLGNVLKVEPNWDRLPVSIPPRVVQVLRVCLQKNPKARMDSAQGVRLALDGAFETTTPASVLPPSGRRRYGLVATGAALVLGVLVGGAAVWSTGVRGSVPEPEVERLSIMTPANRPVYVSTGSLFRDLALSPDGTALVYVTRKLDATAGQAGLGLALRSLATREVRDLPGTSDPSQPFFSPDGQWVAFFTDGGELRKVPVSSGNPVTVADGIEGSSHAFGVWLDDGTIVFGTNATALHRVSADGGPVTDLTELDPARHESFHNFPSAVPSTAAVLFTAVARVEGTARIEAVALDTGARHVVVDDAWGPLMLGSDHLLFHRPDGLLVAPFDGRSLTLAGPAVPFSEEARTDNPTYQWQTADMAVSRGGTLAYLPADERPGWTLGLVSRDGTFDPIGVPPGFIGFPRVSPDGRAIAFGERGTRATDRFSAIRIFDLTRETTVRRGGQDGFFGAAVWQPTSGALAVGGRKGTVTGVFLDAPDGTETLLLPNAPGTVGIQNIAWSPDGTQLAYTVQTGSREDIWILTPGGSPATEPLLDGPASEFSPAFSPDGRWLAYVSDESGRRDVYVQRYPRGERVPVSVDGGVSPVWRRDGTELFFASSGKMTAVSVTPDGESLRLGRPVALFELDTTTSSGEPAVYVVGGNTGVEYDVLPDGRFVMVRQPDQRTTREIVLVRNWLGERQRLEPTK